VRWTIFLAIVAALLGAYILLIERHQPTTDQQRAARGRLLPAFDRARVRRLMIARAGAPSVAITREGPAWRVQPGDKPADDAAVEELLAELDFADADRQADVPRDRAGLAPPRVTLDLDLDDGSRLEVALGLKDASGRGAYAVVGAAPGVRVAPARLADLAERDETAYRDRRVLPFALGAARDLAVGWSTPGKAGHAVASGRIDGGSGRLRNERGEWVNPARVAEALRRLGDLRAARFVAPPVPPPPVQHVLEAGGVGEGPFTLGMRDAGCPESGEELVDRRGPSGVDWMCVSGEAMNGAREALASARARDERLTGMPAAAVTAIDLESGSRRVALRRSGGRWAFGAPSPDYPADSTAVDEWLGALARLQLDFAPAPAASGPVRKLNLAGGQESESLEVSGPRGGVSTVVRVGEPNAARGPADLLALLDPDPLRFRDRTVLDLARLDARRLRVSSRQQVVEVSKGTGDAWIATLPAGAVADSGAIDGVLGALTNLRAQRFVAPSAPFAQDLTLDLAEQPPGATTVVHHVVQLGVRRPEGCFARLVEGDRKPVTFALAPAACDDLRVRITR
jgi:hypothetical protein